MIIFPRRTPKLSNGFEVILEDGTPEKILRWRSNGFKIVVDDVAAIDVDEIIDGMVQEEEEQTSKRQGDGLSTTATPMKRMKWV